MEDCDFKGTLYQALWCNDEDRIRILLRQMVSINRETLDRVWKFVDSWDIMEMALEKHAMGMNLASTFRLNPLQTIFQFSLPSRWVVERCIRGNSSSLLTCSGDEDRLPIHVALTSPNHHIKSPWMILLLFELEPRSALIRDPTTGLYPHESAVMASSDEVRAWWVPAWLNVVYNLFRYNPALFVRARLGLVGPVTSARSDGNQGKATKSNIKTRTEQEDSV